MSSVPGPRASPPRVRLLPNERCADLVAESERALRDGALSVQVGTLSDATLSIGVGVRGAAAYVDRARSEGLEVVRRSSGGTGVLHRPGDVVWSVVLPREDPRVGRDFVRGFARLGRGLVRFLEHRDVEARWMPSPALAEGCCVLSGRGEVLAVGSTILGGAAQHVSGRALLHQGMLPLTVDRELTARVFAIPPAGGVDRLVGLRDVGLSDGDRSIAGEVARFLAADLAGPLPPVA